MPRVSIIRRDPVPSAGRRCQQGETDRGVPPRHLSARRRGAFQTRGAHWLATASWQKRPGVLSLELVSASGANRSLLSEGLTMVRILVVEDAGQQSSRYTRSWKKRARYPWRRSAGAMVWNGSLTTRLTGPWVISSCAATAPGRRLSAIRTLSESAKGAGGPPGPSDCRYSGSGGPGWRSGGQCLETDRSAELVGDAIVGHQARSEAAGVTLEGSLQAGEQFTVMGDRARLGQALREVVENAITFSPSGGRVTLAAELVVQSGRL